MDENQSNFIIKKLQQGDKSDIKKATEFVHLARSEMFAGRNYERFPKDLAYFDEYFITAKFGGFWIISHHDTIVASIGCVPYDERFFGVKQHRPHICQQNSVEVVKLYVLPDYRKRGFASKLVQMVQDFCQKQGVRYMYLHTHPFLTGAEQFWQKQGFIKLYQDDDEWQTVHLMLDL